MPKNSSGMQKSYFWTGFLHKKIKKPKIPFRITVHSMIWSCEKWQAITWPMVGSPPPFKVNILRGLDILKRQKFVQKLCETVVGSRLQFSHLHTNLWGCHQVPVRSTWHWLLRQSAEMDLAPENEFVTLWEILNNVLLLWAGIFPTQDTKPSFGRRPKDGFVSKWVYNFLPSQKLVHLSGYFKHHIGGGQQQKYGAKSSKPYGNFLWRLGNFFCRLAVLFLVWSKNSIRIWFRTSHRGWPTAKIMYETL